MKNMINNLISFIKKYKKDIFINIIVISLMLFASFYNFPVLVYKPGGTIALDSRIYLDGKKIELGDYNLAYVSVSRGNLINIIFANVFKNWDLVKEKNMIIPNSDYESTLKVEKMELQNSISIAKYIAYQKAGKEVSINVSSPLIYGITTDADTDLSILDEIISIDGYNFNYEELGEYINNLEVGDKVSVKVINNGKEYDRYATIISSDNRNIIGVYLLYKYDVETIPSIEIKSKESEAGSSGGLMLTLAIYDALTDGDLTNGKKIVGTGTIELDGSIGSIGGVKYKLLGAQKDHADVFFVPEENYKEAKEVYDKYKLSFDLISIKTFDDVVNYFE